MIHDQFCRCRACKPPLPSDYEIRRGTPPGTGFAIGMAAAAVFWFAIALAVLP